MFLIPCVRAGRDTLCAHACALLCSPRHMHGEAPKAATGSSFPSAPPHAAMQPGSNLLSRTFPPLSPARLVTSPRSTLQNRLGCPCTCERCGVGGRAGAPVEDRGNGDRRKEAAARRLWWHTHRLEAHALARRRCLQAPGGALSLQFTRLQRWHWAHRLSSYLPAGGRHQALHRPDRPHPGRCRREPGHAKL